MSGLSSIFIACKPAQPCQPEFMTEEDFIWIIKKPHHHDQQKRRTEIVSISVEKDLRAKARLCCKVLQDYISISGLVLTSVPARVVEAKLGQRERPGKHQHVRKGQKFDILLQNHLMLLTKIKMIKIEMKIKNRSKV